MATGFFPVAAFFFTFTIDNLERRV